MPPAVTVAVAVPLPVLQVSDNAEVEAVISVDWVMATVCVAEHPVLSVTVTVYVVPAVNPVAVEVYCEGVVDHEYV